METDSRYLQYILIPRIISWDWIVLGERRWLKTVLLKYNWYILSVLIALLFDSICTIVCTYVLWSEVCEVKLLSGVRLFATPWTVAYQAPPSMGFSRQEYWSGLPFPSPGHLPDSGIEPRSPALQADALTSEPPGKTLTYVQTFETTIRVVNSLSSWRFLIPYSNFSLPPLLTFWILS